MYIGKPLRLSSLFLPVLVVGLLQLGGCSSSVGTPPPGGVYTSTSAGAIYDQSVAIADSEENIAKYSLKGLFRSLKDPHIIFIAAADKGVVTSKDNGETWTIISTPLANTGDVVVLDNGVIVIAGSDSEGQGYVYRSLDDGKSWQKVLTVPIPKDSGSLQIIKTNDVIPSIVLNLEIDPFNHDRVYAGNNLGSIFVGEQSAKTWRILYTLHTSQYDPSQDQGKLGLKKILASPFVQGELLVITAQDKLLRINPTGQTPITVPEYIDTPAPFGLAAGSQSVKDVDFIPNFPEALLVATKDAAVVTRDNGVTWIQLKIPADTTAKFNTVVTATSPTNSNRIFVGINDVMYRSEDGGVSWNTYSLELPNHWISDISIDPSNAARMLLTVIPANT